MASIVVNGETITTVEHARVVYDQLIREVQHIEAQLSDKDRRNSTGRRLSNEEYHRWRTLALFAKNQKAAQQRELRAWLSDRVQESSMTATAAPKLAGDSITTRRLLESVLTMIASWQSMGYLRTPLTAEEERVLKLALEAI